MIWDFQVNGCVHLINNKVVRSLSIMFACYEDSIARFVSPPGQHLPTIAVTCGLEPVWLSGDFAKCSKQKKPLHTVVYQRSNQIRLRFTRDPPPRSFRTH